MAAKERIVALHASGHRADALISQLGTLVRDRLAEHTGRPELVALSEGLANPTTHNGDVFVRMRHSHAAEAAAVLTQIAWSRHIETTVYEAEPSAQEGDEYTAVLLYPHCITDSYGVDHTMQTVRSADPFAAVALAQRQAAELAQETTGMDIPAHEFRLVTLLPGHRESVLDAPDLETEPDMAPHAGRNGPQPG